MKKNQPDAGDLSPLEESAVAITELVDALQKAGLTRSEALYWSAIHTAEVNRGGEHGQRPDLD